MALAQGHPFVNGNKRVALWRPTDFYAINGYRLLPESADVIKLADDVANRRVGHEAVASTPKVWATPMALPDLDDDY